MNRTQRNSQLVADHIRNKVLDAMQDAEEMRGPDYPEYIALMDGLAAECAQRATTARGVRDSHKAAAVKFFRAELDRPGIDVFETGSGCQAIFIPEERGAHWLVTEGGSDVPSCIEVEIELGFYPRHGTGFMCFACKDCTAALAIIRAYANAEFAEG